MPNQCMSVTFWMNCPLGNRLLRGTVVVNNGISHVVTAFTAALMTVLLGTKTSRCQLILTPTAERCRPGRWHKCRAAANWAASSQKLVSAAWQAGHTICRLLQSEFERKQQCIATA